MEPERFRFIMENSKLLDGRVAWITGVGSGIGAASAWLLGHHGAKIAAVGRDQEQLRSAVEDFAAAGIEAMPIVADVTDEEATIQGVQAVDERWGRIDVVFANAGINGVWAPIDKLTAEDWEKTLRVNLFGTFLTVKHTVPLLKRQGGSIVVTSSVNGTRMFSNTGASAYASSKAAQVAFAKMMALELAPAQVRVNVICPGAIETNISKNTESRAMDAAGMPVKFPQGQIPLTGREPGSAASVAQLVLFLASDASSHITGTEVWIDGAQSLLQG